MNPSQISSSRCTNSVEREPGHGYEATLESLGMRLDVNLKVTNSAVRRYLMKIMEIGTSTVHKQICFSTYYAMCLVYRGGSIERGVGGGGKEGSCPPPTFLMGGGLPLPFAVYTHRLLSNTGNLHM